MQQVQVKQEPNDTRREPVQVQRPLSAEHQVRQAELVEGDSVDYRIRKLKRNPRRRSHRPAMYNVLFSMILVTRGVSKTRADGGLNAVHIRFVLDVVGLSQDGNLTQLRARLKENLGLCLRPWTPWYLYPRSDWDAYKAAHYEAGLR